MERRFLERRLERLARRRFVERRLAKHRLAGRFLARRRLLERWLARRMLELRRLGLARRVGMERRVVGTLGRLVGSGVGHWLVGSDLGRRRRLDLAVVGHDRGRRSRHDRRDADGLRLGYADALGPDRPA